MRTVIVRLFEPATGTGEVELSGFVEDVAGGTRQRFSGAEELLDAMTRIADRPSTVEGIPG